MFGRSLPHSFGLASLVLALAGCDLAPLPAPPPTQRPPPRVEAPKTVQPSAQSRALEARYRQLQQSLLARGLLRTDGGGPDTPFGTRELTENFIRVALYDEYVFENGRMVARQTPAALRRWEAPVRIGLAFGPTVTPAQRTRDRATVQALVRRIQRLTGHPVSLVEDSRSQGVNYWVHVVGEDDRAALLPQWQSHFPGLTEADFQPVTRMDPSTLCIVLAMSETNAAAYTGALAVIRAELPDLLRSSCLHEEIVQGFGLANDHPSVRPSIFNDDEEFATLTTHDEMLLRILYDRRLRPGMREAQVRPLLPAIVAGLIAPPS